MWPVTINYLEEVHPLTLERARLWDEDRLRVSIASAQSVIPGEPEPERDPALHEMIQEVTRQRQAEHSLFCSCAQCIERRREQDRLFLQRAFASIGSDDTEELRGTTAPMDMCNNEDALEEVCAGGNA